MVGISHSMASRIRAGQRLPGINTIERISVAYGIPLKTLLAARRKGAEELKETGACPTFGELIRKRAFAKKAA